MKTAIQVVKPETKTVKKLPELCEECAWWEKCIRLGKKWQVQYDSCFERGEPWIIIE